MIFTVETDASDVAIAATLNQEGRPVAFFLRTLNKSERNHCSEEKEAYAIIESIRHWRHFLLGKHFKLITDQKSVVYMLDTKHKCKIKNEKILRWRIELQAFSYDIFHRPGKENVASDALTRGFCSAVLKNELLDLHSSLCHPGVARMSHFVRSRNLPYSLDQIKNMTRNCQTCARLKPQFHRPPVTPLIKALNPMDRLSIDFKGPLPCSKNRNKYLFIAVDEFSRFPWAIPCSDLSADTVIKCLTDIFCMFGLPGYVHSDRGASFISTSVKTFLHEKGIATSRSTPYHPTGNSQCEKYVGVVWKTVSLALDSSKLTINCWESVLPDALHSIRSLLCTTTNSTPHERLFSFPRRSANGASIPTWLTTPGKVYLRRHVRNKTDPLVDEVDLIEATPTYAHIRYNDGRESTVSTSDLAPCLVIEEGVKTQETLIESAEIRENPPPIMSPHISSPVSRNVSNFEISRSPETIVQNDSGQCLDTGSTPMTPPPPNIRCSSRIRKPVDRLNL